MLLKPNLDPWVAVTVRSPMEDEGTVKLAENPLAVVVTGGGRCINISFHQML